MASWVWSKKNITLNPEVFWTWFKKNFGLKPGLFCCKKGPRPSPKMSKIEKTDSTEVWVHKKYVFWMKSQDQCYIYVVGSYHHKSGLCYIAVKSLWSDALDQF